MGLLDTGGSIVFALLMFAVFVAAFIGIPLLMIWCLNTLGIAAASYGLWEWIAAAILTGFFLGGSASQA